MQSEIKNRNGRVYPKDVMAKVCTIHKRICRTRSCVYRELGHPDNPTINLDKVSHMITKLEEDNNNYVNRTKILTTPNAKS